MSPTSDDPGGGGKKSRKPKPVFAPEVPADVRKLLTKKSGALLRAGEPAFKPTAPFPAGAVGNVLARLVSGLVVLIVLFLTLESLQWSLPNGVDDWLLTLLKITAAVSAGEAVLDIHRKSSVARAAFEYRGQYLGTKDWDADAKQLMLRAQRAVRDVRKAKVNKEGLLDDIQNDVVLPEQLWEIGQVLQQLSVLRTRHKTIAAGPSDELAGAVTSQAAALRVAEEAMEQKVAMLEKYAGQVRAADAVLKADTALQEALQDGDKYLELLARTESAAQTGLIRNLTAEAAELREQLSRSLDAVRDTSHTLALPVDDDPPPKAT